MACGVASFLAGVFLDIDHFLDCYVNYGWRFKMEDFYTYCREIRFDKLTLVFHSFELIILFWIAIYVFSLGNIAKAIAIGATQHLFFDQMVNVARDRLDPRRYFLLFRLSKGFRKEAIIKR